MSDAADPSGSSASDSVRELVVPASLDGVRLDKAVAELLPELSRARVKRAIDLGVVRVNGRKMSKGSTVTGGDRIGIDIAQVADAPAVPEPGAPLRVVFESAQVAVVDKPAGQPTAPLRPGEVGTLVNAVLGHYPELVPTEEAFVGHSPREPASSTAWTRRRAARSSSPAPPQRSTP
jgi:23S rRNA pseudouridine1911/1915/1917 synthase